jgi:hypothetical protein
LPFANLTAKDCLDIQARRRILSLHHHDHRAGTDHNRPIHAALDAFLVRLSTLQTETSQRELLWGAVLLVILPNRMQHDQPAWPAWDNYGELFRHGVIAAGWPTIICRA